MSETLSLLGWSPPGPRAHFNGPAYSPVKDDKRLTRQHVVIRDLMLDGQWRTLAEIEDATGYPAASISAQLRHCRKARFGGFVVLREIRGKREQGLYQYRVLPPGSELPPKPPTQREINAAQQRRIQDLEAQISDLRHQLNRVRP